MLLLIMPFNKQFLYESPGAYPMHCFTHTQFDVQCTLYTPMVAHTLIDIFGLPATAAAACGKKTGRELAKNWQATGDYPKLGFLTERFGEFQSLSIRFNKIPLESFKQLN